MRTKLFTLLFLVIFSVFNLYGEPTNYTYNYDFWGEQVASPDAYRVGAYILGTTVGTTNFNSPQGLFIRDNFIYVCDTENDRIVIIEVLEDGSHVLNNIYDSVVIDNELSRFSKPHDIFVNGDSSTIYMADTGNNRVLILDGNWNFVHAIYKPEDDSLRNFEEDEDDLEEFTEFIPYKLVVDLANRVFVQARNINKGLMEFSNRWEFSGFMGANKVNFNMLDYIWKLLSTQAQRSRMVLFIPTEYSNVAIDKDGFIYVTNSTGQIDPVRRLNAMGQDILIRNGYVDPVGDLNAGSAANISGPSRFIDVVAFDNDSYACFDSNRGRIFLYDFQGNLLYAFGGRGNREGSFTNPVALDRMGSSLYALDSATSAITRFDLTSYGYLINHALNEYRAGRYESSADVWEEVLKMNGNYDLAYIGIGRAALRQGEYQKAMRYYKLKHFREGYEKAFQLYRKQWMEENLWWLLIVLGAIIFVPSFVRFSIKVVKEIREA